MGQFKCSRNFLIAKNNSSVAIFVQLITLILHYIWCQIFIGALHMGYTGVAIATNLTFILNMLITDLIIRLYQKRIFKHMVFCYDAKCFQDLGQYLKLGLLGTFMPFLQ